MINFCKNINSLVAIVVLSTGVNAAVNVWDGETGDFTDSKWTVDSVSNEEHTSFTDFGHTTTINGGVVNGFNQANVGILDVNDSLTISGGAMINGDYLQITNGSSLIGIVSEQFTFLSGTITLSSANPLRGNNFNGNLNFTGAAGSATIVHTNLQGSITNMLGHKIGAANGDRSYFAIDGRMINSGILYNGSNLAAINAALAATGKIVNGRYFEIVEASGTQTLHLREVGGSGRPAASKGPNIIHILVDDFGYTEHSVPSLVLNPSTELSDFIETPNIVKLASEGVSFTSCYAQPNCAPTRAAYMSGQYSPRSGNGVYNVASLKRSGNSHTTYLNAPNQGGFDDDSEVDDDFINGSADSHPLAKTMYNTGYVTCHIGKYHVGSSVLSDNTSPLNQGFEFNFGGNNNGNPGDFFASGSPRMFNVFVGPELDAFAADYTQSYVDAHIKPFENGNDSDTLVGTRKHLTDANADAFEHFMESHRDVSNATSNYPVYVQLHFYATHAPLDGRPDLVAKYAALKAGGSNPVHDTNNGFAALAENMDQSVARVLRYVNDPNLDGDTSDSIAENTLIIWTTDNGGSEPHTENLPLRGRKGMHLEGGIRVPLIMRMPGSIPAGKVSDTLVHAVDFYPTMLDFTAGSANTLNPNEIKHKLDGESIYEHVLDPENVSRDRAPIFFHFPGYMDSRAYPSSAMIKEIDGERYKYIYNYDPYYSNVDNYGGSPDQYQLYNLTDDPYEVLNLLDYIDIENTNDSGDPSDTREVWDYIANRDIGNVLAAELNTWLIGEPGDSSWNPIYATYKSNFPDSPTRDNAADGVSTGPVTAALPAMDFSSDTVFRVIDSEVLGTTLLNITVSSHAGFKYQVEASSSLSAESWSLLESPVTAVSDSLVITVNDSLRATEEKRFYRVRIAQ